MRPIECRTPLWAFANLRIGLAAEWFIAPQRVAFDSIVEFAAGGPTFVTTGLSVLLVMNVFLCAFNLLPLPPLDGAAVMTSHGESSHS